MASLSIVRFSATLRCQLRVSILLNHEPVIEPHVAAANSLLLFRATLVSEPMGVYQRRILLRVIRRLGSTLSSTYVNRTRSA